MKLPKDPTTYKKRLIIATWLNQAWKEFGSMTLEEVELNVTLITSPIQMAHLPKMDLQDCRIIAKEAQLPFDESKLALAIFRGLSKPRLTLSQLGYRRCSGCCEAKPFDEFKGDSRLCIECKREYNRSHYLAKLP